MQDDRSKNRGKAALLSAFPRFKTYVNLVFFPSFPNISIV